MKLFIWNDPYDVNWGGSCLYVLAESLEQAKEQAKKTVIAKFGSNPDSKTFEFQVGEPDRVIEGPYAEAYEWAE
jgi:hypothetical protein